MADNEDTNDGNTDHFSYIKDLVRQAGQNLANSQNMINTQTHMTIKKLKDPNYQPSDDEKANEQKYMDAMAQGVVGSIAPVGRVSSDTMPLARKAFFGSPLSQEAGAIARSNTVTDMAPSTIGQYNPITMQDIGRAQQAQSRAIDMADRYRKQVDPRTAALRKFASQ